MVRLLFHLKDEHFFPCLSNRGIPQVLAMTSPTPSYIWLVKCMKKSMANLVYILQWNENSAPDLLVMLSWYKQNKTAYGWAGTGQGMTFCDRRENGGWTNPRLRVQQAAGLRTKASNKELEQRECPALSPPTPLVSIFYSFCINMHKFTFFCKNPPICLTIINNYAK